MKAIRKSHYITYIIVVVILAAYFGLKSIGTLGPLAVLFTAGYEPSGVCTAALAPAYHKLTGLRHTFSNGCIPPGWEREELAGD